MLLAQKNPASSKHRILADSTCKQRNQIKSNSVAKYQDWNQNCTLAMDTTLSNNGCQVNRPNIEAKMYSDLDWSSFPDTYSLPKDAGLSDNDCHINRLDTDANINSDIECCSLPYTDVHLMPSFKRPYPYDLDDACKHCRHTETRKDHQPPSQNTKYSNSQSTACSKVKDTACTDPVPDVDKTTHDGKAEKQFQNVALPALSPYCSNGTYSAASTLRALTSGRSCSSSFLRFSPGWRANAFRLSTHHARVTVLFLDIKDFTARCAALPAAAVGEWVAAFYSRVDAAAAAHGVRKVEVRGDCCVCVAGAEAAVPWPAAPAVAAAVEDRRADQATRMLAFAAELHRALADLHSHRGGATAVRMGVATGPATFLISEPGGAGAAFVSVQGDAAALAARMEALSAPGVVHVHRSTADQWAKEQRRPPPPTTVVECGGRGPQRVAVYDCAGRAFRPGPDCPFTASARSATQSTRRASVS